MATHLADLQAFIAVAQAQGFREGARHSGVSASNLSEAVRRLEERLGVRLFNRTTRSVVPTDAGRLLLARVALPWASWNRPSTRSTNSAAGRWATCASTCR